MKLIIESGSTKTAWAFVSPTDVLQVVTPGWNPATRDSEKLNQTENLPFHLFSKIEQTYYYGAGVRNGTIRQKVTQVLLDLGIPDKIYVESDMLAVARACCGSHPGWVAILGTGSNLAYYDGQTIVQRSPSLGYVLGDEGSGFQLGREILRQYFNHLMPETIRKKFESMHSLTADSVIENTYRSGDKNAYVASFASFLSDEQGEWKTHLVTRVFQEFFDYKILPIPFPKSETLHFCGSVAYHFKDLLATAALANGIQIGEVIASPLEKLILYHR